MDNEEPVISYTVRELFERVDEKLDRMLVSYEGLEARVAAIESRNQHSAWNREWKKWSIPAASSVLATAALIVSVIPH